VILAFGDCELDEALYALRRRGKPVKLEPKVFDVLLYLVRQRARVVTKEELLDALWPGEAVSDSVLPRCIAAARRAVGDTRGRHPVIQTVHRRGYRFVAPVAAPAETSPAAAQGAPPAAPFVGREAVLGALRGALAAAAGGRLRVLLLAGEPGIGKTRTLAELAREAAGRGFRCAEGRCYEGEGAPAFWPWLQILRDLVSDATAASLEAELGAGAPDLAELLPELRRKLPRLPRPDDPGSDQARFRLFDSVAGFLARSAARRPLLLALDDLHWGDADSLRLFDFVAAAPGAAPILLLGAYRDVEVRRDRPLAQLLGRLAGRAHVERSELRGLGDDAVAELVSALAGAPARPEVTAALAERSGGNPFFVHELIRLLLDEGRLDAGADALSALALPQGVRDAIGRRLDRLSPACSELLQAAAAAGRSFELRVLEQLCERPRQELLEQLAEAQAAGLVTPSPTGVGRFAFAHALIHQALYEELSVPRRVALHRRAGEALLALHAGRADAPAAELAHHFFEAAAGGAAAQAAEWCERAADQALALYAYDEGARQLARALEALDHSAPDPARRAALLMGRGEARWAAGDREGGRARLAEAADAAHALGRDDLFARAALAYRGVGEMGMLPDARTLALLEQARDRIGVDAPGLRARVLARLAGTPPYALSMATREALAGEAWALAQRSGESEALADALGARYWATLGPDRVEERLSVAEQARALAERTGDRALAQLAAEAALGAHLLRGDRAAADRVLQRYVETAEALRRPVFRMLATAALASRAMGTGEYAAAERLLDQARDLARGSVPYADALHAGHRLWLAFQRGDLTVADPAAGSAGWVEALQLSEQTGYQATFENLAKALLLSQAGDAEQARRGLDAFAGDDFARVERDEHWMLAMGMLTVAVTRLGDRARAEALYARLLPVRHLMVSHDLMRAVAGSVEAPLGSLALACGRAADALGHFEAAQARERAMALRPALVRSALGLAAALELRGGPGDAERAARTRAEAAAEAARLGMRLAQLPEPAQKPV
jgi:DNA-binding winged helix-turn-helix (wHTH) protein